MARLPRKEQQDSLRLMIFRGIGYSKGNFHFDRKLFISIIIYPSKIGMCVGMPDL